MVKLAPGDILVVAEPFSIEKDLALIHKARVERCDVVVIVLDLIPYLYPQLCDERHAPVARQWFATILPLSDRILCISKAVAFDVKRYLECNTFGAARPKPKIGWFHLGSDLDEIKGGSANSSLIRLALAGDRPLFLSVGTVEPRKAYPTAIEAFEKLWAAGYDAAYLICGMKGWRVSNFAKRIRIHPEYGKRLFWCENASDADLALAYGKAAALVYPSIAEGFGLPLVEASRFGCPIIASDIPVFRELTEDSASYFDVLDPEGLKRCIVDRIEGRYKRPSFGVLSWRQAAEDVFRLAEDHPSVSDRWI